MSDLTGINRVWTSAQTKQPQIPDILIMNYPKTGSPAPPATPCSHSAWPTTSWGSGTSGSPRRPPAPFSPECRRTPQPGRKDFRQRGTGENTHELTNTLHSYSGSHDSAAAAVTGVTSWRIWTFQTQTDICSFKCEHSCSVTGHQGSSQVSSH